MRQPLIEATGTSVFGLIYTIKDDKIYMLVQAVSEVGCFDKIEIGPSVQIGPNAKNTWIGRTIIFVKNYKMEKIFIFLAYSQRRVGGFTMSKIEMYLCFWITRTYLIFLRTTFGLTLIHLIFWFSLTTVSTSN